MDKVIVINYEDKKPPENKTEEIIEAVILEPEILYPHEFDKFKGI